MRKSFTYRQIALILRGLYGTPEQPGLAYARLPVAGVLLPLRSFEKAATPHLQTAQELINAGASADDITEIEARQVEVAFTPVDLATLDQPGYSLTLAQLEILELLAGPSPEPEDPEGEAP